MRLDLQQVLATVGDHRAERHRPGGVVDVERDGDLVVGAAGLAGALEDDRLVGHRDHRDVGPDQPGMAPAQTDQGLVHEQDRPAQQGQVLRPGRHRRADLVVTARTVLLGADEPLLVAVVDRRDAGQHRQQHHGVAEVTVVVQPAADPGDVVVADERLRHEGPQELLVAFHGMGQLPQVGVVERGPDRLPQLVLGEAVQARPGDEVGQVAVDHLAAQPGLGEVGPDPRGDRGPGLRPGGVRGVEAPPVDAERQPVLHHGDHVVTDGRGGQLELGQVEVALEAADVAVDPLHPGAVRGARPGGLGPDHRRVAPGDMVEDTVEDDPDTAAVRLVDQSAQVGLVTQPRIDPVVVHGVVPVRDGGEDRPQQQAVAADRDQVVQPVDQVVEAVVDDIAGDRRTFRPGEPEGVAVPPHGVVDPGWLAHGHVPSLVMWESSHFLTMWNGQTHRGRSGGRMRPIDTGGQERCGSGASVHVLHRRRPVRITPARKPPVDRPTRSGPFC
ncbi:hypothetical protein SDC9_78649 [bioreactor metagenome]|uniref:Uncharacterized protein n=1 Tax=bioreactor metagenome TaxID=1076179 RepID=A0A644YU22_9ZZZZ